VRSVALESQGKVVFTAQFISPFMFRASVRRAFRPVLALRRQQNLAPIRFYSQNSPSDPITPWYVAEAVKNTGPDVTKMSVDLPTMPQNRPESLEKVVEFAMNDMGLKDVVVVDKRGADEESTALGPALMVLGTGTSSKHLGSAGALLMTWLKKNYHIYAGREGVLTTNFVKLHNRRQKRRQQRHRTAKEDSQLQRVGSWIAVDTKLDNIYVHLMTADRRAEVDLENLGEYLEEDADPADLEKLEQQFAEPAPAHGHPTKNPGKLGRRSYSTQSTVPSSREELALENLAAEKREDLAEDSPEVLSFVQHFPEVPLREHWKQRLNFFALAVIQSSLFSPSRLIKEAELQQASGFVLDAEDVELIVSAICYHGQAHFSTLSRDDESVAAWAEMCNIKADLLVQLYDFALRPLGRSLITNERLLTLLYRTFTGLCASSTTPSQALAAVNTPASQPLEVFMDVRRAVALRYLLETTGEMKNLQTVSMLLTSLCTKDQFDAFWKTCSIATLNAANPEFSEHIVDLAVSLVVHSGDHAQIKYAIQSFVPNLIMAGNVRLTRTTVKAMDAGLAIVDSQRNGNFESVRKIIAQFDSTPQLT